MRAERCSDHCISRRRRYHRQPGERRTGHRPIEGCGGASNNRHDRRGIGRNSLYLHGANGREWAIDAFAAMRQGRSDGARAHGRAGAVSNSPNRKPPGLPHRARPPRRGDCAGGEFPDLPSGVREGATLEARGHYSLRPPCVVIDPLTSANLFQDH